MYIALSRQKQIKPCFSSEENSWFNSRDEALEWVKQENPWAKDCRIESTLDTGIWKIIYKTYLGDKKTIDTIFTQENIGKFIPAVQ